MQVDHWLEFSARRLCGQPLTAALGELDKALSLRTFLVGHALTLADLSVWAALKGQYNPVWLCFRCIVFLLMTVYFIFYFVHTALSLVQYDQQTLYKFAFHPDQLTKPYT